MNETRVEIMSGDNDTMRSYIGQIWDVELDLSGRFRKHDYTWAPYHYEVIPKLEEQFLVNENGDVFAINRVSRCNINDLISEEASRKISLKLNHDLWYQKLENKEYFTKKIPSLIIKTQYKINNDLKCYPTFQMYETSASTTRTITSDHLYLTYEKCNMEFYLMWKNKPVCLGNIFPGGKICLGDDQLDKIRESSKGCLDSLDVCLENLNTTTWQYDLMTIEKEELLKELTFSIEKDIMIGSFDSIMEKYSFDQGNSQIKEIMEFIINE